MLPLTASPFPVDDPFPSWFTLFSTHSWIAAQAILHKPRMWQACTSRHSFAVNCLFDLKIWNQETTELCCYWWFFFLRYYLYIGHLATKPIQLCPCLPRSPSPQFLPCLSSLCVVSILTCCSNICLSLLSLTITHKTLVPLIPHKAQQEEGKCLLCLTVHIFSKCIFSECANCICLLVCF